MSSTQENKSSTLQTDGKTLASEELVDKLPNVQFDEIDTLSNRTVIVVVDRVVAGRQALIPITGILVSVLFDAKPEIEIKMFIDDAFDIVESNSQHFNCFELHKGEKIIPLKGPFIVSAARIQDIDIKTQMCVLSMQLERAKKS